MGDYPGFVKIPRWDREIVLTEKIDGTNGLVSVEEWTTKPTWPVSGETYVALHESPDDVRHFVVKAGSRNRWLAPEQDSHGFAKWVRDNAEELARLGPGNHYGEWYGKGINRGYGLDEKRFMLFNVSRWGDPAARPSCCEVATVLVTTTGACLSFHLLQAAATLAGDGSQHVPGYDRPEGIVLYHTAANSLFKVTLNGDGHKSRDVR